MENFILRGMRISLLIFLLFFISSAKAQTNFIVEITDITAAQCGSNGSITTMATGGTAPYSANIVSLDNTTPSQMVSNLTDGETVTFSAPTGEYFIIFSDSEGISEQCPGTIEIPPALPSFDLNASNIYCAGSNSSATIEATATGNCSFHPTHLFTLYAPDGTVVDVNNTGLFSQGITTGGTYTLIASDNNGNTETSTINVQVLVEHTDVWLAVNDLQHACGANQGSVSISAQGTPVNNVTYYILNTFTGLIQSNTTGDFIVDEGIYAQWFEFNVNGSTESCVWECPNGFVVLSSDLVVDTQGFLPCSDNATDYLAYGSDYLGGYTDNLSVTGGSGDYSYLWSTGETTENISNLFSGTYTVTVTDNTTGCTAEDELVLVALPPLEIDYDTIQEALCYGDTVIINVIASGGYNNANYYEYYINGISQGVNNQIIIIPGIPTEVAICE